MGRNVNKSTGHRPFKLTSEAEYSIINNMLSCGIFGCLAKMYKKIIIYKNNFFNNKRSLVYKPREANFIKRYKSIEASKKVQISEG